MAAKPVGIDLGTYNSVVAYRGNDGALKIAVSDWGGTTQGMVFPSFVKFNALGMPVRFGEEARLEKAQPSSVVWGVKRLIGKGYDQIQSELSKFLYKIEKSQHGVVIPQGKANYSPTEISSMILVWIKKCIEDNTLNPLIGSPVEKAVISHPAYFDEIEKGETRKAAEKAGFNEVRLITEPEAAALSYGLMLDPKDEPYVMVIDWGAGTLDIAIHQLRLGKDNLPTMPKANPAHGDLHLGGIDMDDIIVDWVISTQDFRELHNLRDRLHRHLAINYEDEETVSLLRSVMALNIESQEAKMDLSTVESSTKYFPYRGRQCSFTFTRKQLEKEIEPLLVKFRKHIIWAIKDANLTEKDIEAVLLVGGPMKMPSVRHAVLEVFAANKHVEKQLRELEKYLQSHEWKFPPNIDPMECVAKGAALYAEQLWSKNIQGGRDGLIKKGRDMTAFDIGILLSHIVGTVLIKRGVSLPAHGETTLGGQMPFGGSQSVSMYKEEVDVDTFQYKYIRRGDYEFSPMADSKGYTQFFVSMDITENGEVKASFKDLITGSSMNLLGLENIESEEISKPIEPEIKYIPPIPEGQKNQQENQPQPAQTVKPATAEMVNMVRSRGKGHLQLARNRIKAPDVAERARKIVEDACIELEKAIARLPSQGPATYKSWQDVKFRCEEVRNRLHLTGLLTKQEEDALSLGE